MKAYRSPLRAFNSISILLLVIVSLGSGGPAAGRPALYRYANGITLAAATELPIYKITSPAVTIEGTQVLTRVFDGIFDDTGLILEKDDYIGHSRFTGLNPQKNTILEQFGATGGFYAYEPTRAFGAASLVQDPALDPARAQLLACQFLLRNQASLVPTSENLQIPGLLPKCDHNFATDPLYKVSTETLSGQSSTPGAQTSHKPIRIMVTVPILVYNERLPQIPTIPLGGPGGHISMIFDDTTAQPNIPGPSLDSNIVGLQAVAMPAFGRSLTFLRTVPAVDPAVAMDQVLQQVKEAFPDGTNIQVPDPALAFFVTDAAQPQTVLEPDLTFAGVTVDVNGQTHVLKDIVLPAVQSGAGGLGPTIAILSPQDGDVNFQGRTFSLSGQISEGQPPYSYEWQLGDGTSLGAGTLDSAGTLPPLNTTLPLPDNKGAPGDLSVHLVVTDDEGITRQQAVSLVSPVSSFLPLVSKGLLGAASPAAGAPAQPPDEVQTMLATNYRFGVEYGSDYPPYGYGGSDLGGVPPDANGFSAGLMGLGWPRVFNWYNSLAWERDWRDCSLGGSDCTYGVDRADFVYYSGHGSNGGLSVPSNSHDSSWFDGTNARFQNARWVSFSSCLTLRAQWPTAGGEPIRKWFNAFQGAHMLMGFNGLMADIAFGPRLVDNMRMPSYLFFGDAPWAQRTIAEAWVQTAFQMNAGKPAYIYATSITVNPSLNKLPKVSDPLLPRPYPVNWFYWVWWND